MQKADALILTSNRYVPAKMGAPLLRLDTLPRERWLPTVSAWLSRHVLWSRQKLALVWDRDDHPDAALLAAIQQHYQQAHLNQFTVEQRAETWAHHFLLTLARQPAWATSMGEPFAGRPAFIVAAGWGLDGNGHVLREAQKRGVVIAVNTSARACLHHGCVPDVVVCSEAKDLRDHLEPLRELGVPIVLDATAHPENWSVASRALGFIHNDPNLEPYARQLGQIPIAYDASCTCAAASLAILWGCRPIVFVGQNLGYSGERCYAAGTPFEDLRWRYEDGCIYFSGESKTMHPMPAEPIAGWGGGEVLGVAAFTGALRWIEGAAQREYIINATEGGPRIAGTHERRLADVVAELPERERVELPQPEPVDTGEVRADLVRQARAVLASDATRAPDEFPLLNLWAKTAWLRTSDEDSVATKTAAVRDAMERGCRIVMEVLG